MRVLWASCGFLALFLGVLGVALPLLPTVPFILLAAFCFARSSDRLHDWLVGHPTFGPPIRDWRENGSVSLRGKKMATISVAAVFGLSIAMDVRPMILAIQAATLCAVMLFLWTRPTSPR